ncbi:hypothetical protein N9B71_01310 [Pirellulales bacterium]|nr:hypothetical protein [Pirellulales bacterium]
MMSVPYKSPTSDTSTRICKSCQQTYSITEFRRRTQSDRRRMHQCRLCHNQAEQLRRQRKRGWLTKHQFHQYLTSLKNQRTARGVEKVYLDLVRLCGGTEGILGMWTKTIEKDLEAGGFKAHRHIASILKLMEYCESTQPDKPDYSTMSDEELLERVGFLSD